MNVGFISLGCSKNLVVTEEVIGMFKKEGFEIINKGNIADIIIINTCGFIESAKQEAIDTILEMAQYKDGRCKYLIAIGCMVERYEEELRKALPEVDLFIKIKDYNKIWTKISELLKLEISNECLSWKDRVITTGNTKAYLKIAEGCSNHCTYCAIPKIQGQYISRGFEEIIEEAKSLSKKGIKELIVIAQDTTKYGIDLYKKPRLAELLQELCKIDGIVWIRFLYAYPESITDELIKVVKENDKICKYFDIPIQHFSDDILKKMNRKTTGKNIINIINRIREEIPEAIIRTSLIVGFPGETEEDFICLEKAVKDIRFDRLGCFTYSKEDGTPAAKFENQVHSKTKEKRRNIVMRLQNAISEEKMQSRVGEVHEVLICDISDDGLFYVGRSYMDSPDTDGVIYISGAKEDIMNKFVRCKIVGFEEYDLFAEVIE